MAEPALHGRADAAQESLGDLVALAVSDISQLVRYEVDLAKIELKADAKRVGIGGALLGAAGESFFDTFFRDPGRIGFIAALLAIGAVLLGVGESSDAYHMSAPHPEGLGARLAMQRALDAAGVQPSALDYINLHGTGTPANDRAEDAALYALFGGAARVSSTKGWTGHTLGAAGIVEAAISVLCIERGFLPGTLNTGRPDPALRTRVVLESEERPLRRVLSNSFGFGGNNCSLLFGRAA